MLHVILSFFRLVSCRLHTVAFKQRKISQREMLDQPWSGNRVVSSPREGLSDGLHEHTKNNLTTALKMSFDDFLVEIVGPVGNNIP